ncbi:hypothetical protein TWF281_002380 [Arthrobotrys megalospora]
MSSRTLSDLPPEVLGEIAKFLPNDGLAKLSRTSQLFYDVSTPVLYRIAKVKVHALSNHLVPIPAGQYQMLHQKKELHQYIHHVILLGPNRPVSGSESLGYHIDIEERRGCAEMEAACALYLLDMADPMKVTTFQLSETWPIRSCIKVLRRLDAFRYLRILELSFQMTGTTKTPKQLPPGLSFPYLKVFRALEIVNKTRILLVHSILHSTNSLEEVAVHYDPEEETSLTSGGRARQISIVRAIEKLLNDTVLGEIENQQGVVRLDVNIQFQTDTKLPALEGILSTGRLKDLSIRIADGHGYGIREPDDSDESDHDHDDDNHGDQDNDDESGDYYDGDDSYDDGEDEDEDDENEQSQEHENGEQEQEGEEELDYQHTMAQPFNQTSTLNLRKICIVIPANCRNECLLSAVEFIKAQNTGLETIQLSWSDDANFLFSAQGAFAWDEGYWNESARQILHRQKSCLKRLYIEIRLSNREETDLMSDVWETAVLQIGVNLDAIGLVYHKLDWDGIYGYFVPSPLSTRRLARRASIFEKFETVHLFIRHPIPERNILSILDPLVHYWPVNPVQLPRLRHLIVNNLTCFRGGFEIIVQVSWLAIGPMGTINPHGYAMYLFRKDCEWLKDQGVEVEYHPEYPNTMVRRSVI